ncbi:hypothetical protein INR49_015656 [Caranx melampygus]|nr:hypothetical protein INR49_015656 [Caranx melampygus]
MFTPQQQPRQCGGTPVVQHDITVRMMELQTEKRFHNLTLEQVQALDKVLTEIIPIHGRGNFPTLQVRAKDIIRVVKDRLVERDIQVKDIRLNGATASHVLVKDNGLGYSDLDIIFGVELPRQEDFQVIKEVVLGSLRDLLPCGVNRRKITCLTMKEAYVQKMVKVFNEHDRWSLISLSNNRAKTVGLRFVSSLRRQFEFSVDSFQIILDRMLESYWETERKQGGKLALNAGNLAKKDNVDGNKEQAPSSNSREVQEDNEKDSAMATGGNSQCLDEADSVLEKDLPCSKAEDADGDHVAQQASEPESSNLQQEEVDGIEDVHSEEDIVFELCEETGEEKEQFHGAYSLVSSPKTLFTEVRDPLISYNAVVSPIEIPKPLQPKPPSLDSAPVPSSNDPASKSEDFQGTDALTVPTNSSASALQSGTGSNGSEEQSVKPKHSKKPPDSETQNHTPVADATTQPQVDEQKPDMTDSVPNSCGSSSWMGAAGEPTITVEAECMYGDFEQAMHHLRHRLIATHNPEEIRGGGLLKYSDLLVRNFRPASETEIKSLERYMCSRFFIDFPDVSEQQRKIEAYLQCHFIGNEEASKYDYLMTLRRVIDESTVCLMGHERRQTLNMITVLALRVLGEQNAIPNTANVTCFYQPAPYMTEPIYSSYFITQAQPPLIYHPYPLHVHMQTGLSELFSLSDDDEEEDDDEVEDDSDEELLDTDASSSLSACSASRPGRCLEPLLRFKLRWCPDATQEDAEPLTSPSLVLKGRLVVGDDGDDVFLKESRQAEGHGVDLDIKR